MPTKYFGRNLKLLLALVFVSICTHAEAQFTIPETRPNPTTIISSMDSMRTLDNINSEFFSPAKARVEKLARRKERNTFEISATLNLKQTQFENWVAGGDNTFSGSSTLFLKYAHQRKKFGFNITFDARYGMSYIDKKMFKNEDKFALKTQATWKMNKKWSYSTDAELRSQFSPGFKSRNDKTKTSQFMAPGNFAMSGGFAYKNGSWQIDISPVGGNAVFMLDDKLSTLGLNGVPKNQKSKWQLGPSIRVNFNKDFFKKVVSVRSEFYTFSNLKTIPTARWETSCKIKATKFLTTTLYTKMQYEKPTLDKIQYQYSIEIGLAYVFKNKK